jgi:hypothetical protein
LTQEEVAQLAGTNKSYISNLKRIWKTSGFRPCKESSKMAWAGILNCP